ncbi:MAG: acyl carrier protein [Clostridia bacterium]|nr:acyl carrier protein [Clostridia bacterium]
MDKIIEMLLQLHPDLDIECDSLVDDGILNSIDVVTLVTEIFNEFDVTVPASEIVPENFNSAEAIWEMVSGLLDE